MVEVRVQRSTGIAVGIQFCFVGGVFSRAAIPFIR